MSSARAPFIIYVRVSQIYFHILTIVVLYMVSLCAISHVPSYLSLSLHLYLFTAAVQCTSSSASATDPKPHLPILPGESYTICIQLCYACVCTHITCNSQCHVHCMCMQMYVYTCSLTVRIMTSLPLFSVPFFILGASHSVETGMETTLSVAEMSCDVGGVERVKSGGMGSGRERVNPGVGRRRGREKAKCVSQ